MSGTLFNLGQTVITATADHRIRELTYHDSEQLKMAVVGMLRRHVRGDWGILDDHDKRCNQNAVLDGSRILSKYELKNTVGDSEAFYIITDAVEDGDTPRDVTTIMLPSDY